MPVKVNWIEMWDLEDDGVHALAWLEEEAKPHMAYTIFRIGPYLIVYNKPTTSEEARKDYADYMVITTDGDR